MAPARQPDDYQVQEELALYSTLCALEAQSGEGAKQVELHKNMFRKHNLKAFEFILYHTYSIVKGKAAAKKHLKWPYADKDPKQKKEFYANASAWLKESCVLDSHGSSLEAFKRNPQGPKLVSFLLDLVTYALNVQHERMFPGDTMVQNDFMDDQLLLLLGEPLITSAKAQIQQQIQRLLQALKLGADTQQQAEQSAARMSDLYYSLRAQLLQAQAPGNLPEIPANLEHIYHGYGQADVGRVSQQCMQLPEDLLQTCAKLEGLWVQVEQHAQQYKNLLQIVDALSCSDVHPHAVDAVKLRQFGQLPTAPNAAGLDIAAMMEAWLVDVGAVCRYIRYLAGHSDGEPPHSATSPPTAATPLLATSEASSHAPHLYAQLGLHRSCLEHMKAMKTAMQTQIAEIVDRIQKLERELYGLISVERQACLTAMESVPLLPGTEQEFHFVRQPAAALSHGTSHGTSMGLFNNSSLPLVPPTPMLQQLVEKSNAQNQQTTCCLQSAKHHLVPSALPTCQPPCTTALADDPSSRSLHYPETTDSPTHSEPVSSASIVSSTALPASELLLSHEHAVELIDPDELMDPDLINLDLVDSDDDIYQPSRCKPPSQQPASGDRFDPLRLSVPSTSSGYSDLLQTVVLQGTLQQSGSQPSTIAQHRDESPDGEGGNPDKGQIGWSGKTESLERGEETAPRSDCFSTARPRRLTFAAAVSGDDIGSATQSRSINNLPSPGSSEVSSGSPGAQSAVQQALGHQAGLSLSLLRQRFAAAQQQ